MLNDLDVIIGSPRDLTIKATRQMLIDSPLITLKATQSGSGIISILTNAIAVSASESCVVNAPAIGLHGAVQVPTILTATNIRATVYANGAVDPAYQPSSINLADGSGTEAMVAPDTKMPAVQRHAVAWEQFSEAMTAIVDCFNQVQGRIGQPTTQEVLLPIAVTGEMTNLQGT
jgi:hypothetical protein